jgi:hypothetical protein
MTTTIACRLCTDHHPDPTPKPCPGSCNRAWVAAERHQAATGEAHDLQPTPGQPLWCPECRGRIEDDLADLPQLVARLGSGPLAPPDPATGHLHLVDVHKSPSPAFDLRDEVERWAGHWADATRARLSHPAGTSTYGYLVGQLSPILAQDPDGIVFGMETLTWHRRLSHTTGGIRLTYRVPGECGTCHRRGTLERRDGTELVKCTACRACVDYERQTSAA